MLAAKYPEINPLWRFVSLMKTTMKTIMKTSNSRLNQDTKINRPKKRQDRSFTKQELSKKQWH